MSIADFFITVFKGVFILPRELGHITVYALCVVSILIINESILVLMFNILSKTKYYYVYSISIVILNAVLLLALRKLDASVAKTELLISVLMITVMSVITVIVVK